MGKTPNEQITDMNKKICELKQENKQLKERIAELEKENLDLGFETDFIKEKGTCAFCEYLDNEVIKELKEQLAIREKVLKNMHEMIKIYVKELFNEEAFSIEHFIEQAKESTK